MKQKILIIQLRQLGDILLTTPLLREIKREHPQAQLTFLSHRMGKLILDGNPYLDEYFTYHESETLLSQIKLAQVLRQRAFDQVFDFMGNPRSAILSFASRGHERFAFNSVRRLAYTDVTPRPNSGDYIVREKFQLLRAAGFNPQDEALVLPWVEAHTGPLVKTMGENNTFKEASMRIVLSPTHRREVRRWPLERYAQLSDYLTTKYGACIFWLWGPGEEAVVDEAMKFCQRPSFKCPPTSFREMAAFIANQDLFIGNSNGPSHVAVATQISSLQLHGHTVGSAWSPLNDLHKVLQSPLQASDPEHAMAAISLGDVIQSLESWWPLLSARAASRRVKGLRLSWRK